MLDLERFVQDCRDARREDPSHKPVREIMASAFADPRGVLAAVGEPDRAGVYKLHHSDDLTIINVVWGPHMTLMPHDHRMWAIIGIYTGREDNIFWRRIADDGQGRIEAAGAKAMCEGDVTPLGRDIVHSVTNPVRRLTGAIHVYGGDFFAEPRSEWDPETLVEQSYDIDKNMRLFEESNAALMSRAS